MNYSVDKKTVIYADLDETEGVVLNLATANYYRLNETGQFIWRRLMDRQSADTIAKEMSEAYDVSDDEAAGDLRDFLSAALEEKLLETS